MDPATITPCYDEATIINPDINTRRLRSMLTVGVAILLAGSLALSGCTATTGAQAGDNGSGSSDDGQEHRQQAALDHALDEYLQANPGLIASVSLSDPESTLDYGDDNRYETASIAKVEILVRWLMLRQNAALPEDELQLAKAMISSSDNEAASDLCDIVTGTGNPDAIPGGTNACVTSPGWGTNETTAKSQRQILEAAFDSAMLSTRSQAVLEVLMGSIDPDQSWGVSAASNENEDYWLKNGWDVRDNGWVAHSDGVIETASGDNLYLVVLTDGSASEAEGITHVEEIAQLARAAHDTD